MTPWNVSHTAPRGGPAVHNVVRPAFQVDAPAAGLVAPGASGVPRTTRVSAAVRPTFQARRPPVVRGRLGTQGAPRHAPAARRAPGAGRRAQGAPGHGPAARTHQAT